VTSIKWQQEAESIIASAEIDDDRIILLARSEGRYGIRSGVLPVPTDAIDCPRESLLSAIETDPQRLAVLRVLRALDVQFSWASRFLDERLHIVYRGSRLLLAFLERRLLVNRSSNAIEISANSAELHLCAPLAERPSARADTDCSAEDSRSFDIVRAPDDRVFPSRYPSNQEKMRHCFTSPMNSEEVANAATPHVLKQEQR
jgi:hypothetical protein